MARQIEKRCEGCQRLFVAARKDQRFHDARCKAQHWRNVQAAEEDAPDDPLAQALIRAFSYALRARWKRRPLFARCNLFSSQRSSSRCLSLLPRSRTMRPARALRRVSRGTREQRRGHVAC